MLGSLKRESDFNSSTKRIAYLLKKLILEPEYHVITDIADELSVSRNTLNSDLKNARSKLKEYNVEIESLTSKGIRLIGKKLNIIILHNNDLTLNYEVFTNKTGKYIKILGAHFKDRKDIPDLNKKKNFYLKDNLWWAVNRFEKYLEKENGCAPTQPK